MIDDDDSIYHRIFSHPEMVADLLRNFLEPNLLTELDLSHMRRMNTKFTARTGQRRRGDVVWEIPTCAGSSVFLILILEFQSDIDEWMVLRLDVYVGLLYQQLVDERKLKPADGLPPVLPIVLYNGEKPRWNAATSLRDLIRLPAGSPLWQYQPEMRYYVIDEGKFPDEDLKGRWSLTAVFFRIQHPATPASVLDASRDLVVWFDRHPDGPPVKRLFRELLVVALERVKNNNPRPPVPVELEEVVIMLTNYIDQWEKDIEQRGILIGEKNGEKNGILKGEMRTLLLQIQRRFGPVPEWVHARLASANLETLDMWTENILDAISLEDVFRGRDRQ
ncbi:MAG: Rpn family recombination-promoting nuclease/putative transposase [Magnetococcus sp. DMHC-1]